MVTKVKKHIRGYLYLVITLFIIRFLLEGTFVSSSKMLISQYLFQKGSS